ncbi:hypothetical protein [Marivirga harenae]|uniref:hypothetical protein n=1 Tax=Marivirga harenae TaxID=2010992 RepID=UPI0026E046A5|nr:hypothetical protein [Marivirga harenae]WKV11880.1 hypothetical protein Q3Y49_16890 [Marivirga harenae]
MRYTILLVLTTLFFGCDSKQESKDYGELPKAAVNITDTLEVDYQGNLKIADFHRKVELFIAVDYARNKEVILIFDRNGDIKSTFDNRIAGENSVSGKINAVGFNEAENGYIIISEGGVYYFDSNWTIYRHIPNPKKGIYTRYNPGNSFFEFKNGETNYIVTQLLAPPTGYTIEEEEYYDNVKLLTIINTNDSTYKLDVGFHEKSNYRTESKLYTPFLSYYDYLENENRLVTTYRNDKNLYYYSMDSDGELQYDKSYSFEFDYYSIKSNFSYGDNFENIKTIFDSRIESLICFQDRLFISYTKAVDNTEFAHDPSLYYDSGYLMDYIIQNYQHCLHVIDEGKKTYQDIILPDMLVAPGAILEKDELIFHLSKSKYEFNNEVFLIGKINIL